jgi:HopJ type III effector protein
MKYIAAVILVASSASAFMLAPTFTRLSSTHLQAEIRKPSEKAETLRFGWDGSTALGGAVVDSKPARMLDQIRDVGETIPSDCEVFNANAEMSADVLTFEEVIDLIDTHYEYGLIEFKNGDVVNQQGENEGSAKLLSYAALSGMDKASTLKLWGQYYRDVLANPSGTDHANIRNFIKSGWEGVPFENGIALTKKCVGENEWDEFAESWIP